MNTDQNLILGRDAFRYNHEAIDRQLIEEGMRQGLGGSADNDFVKGLMFGYAEVAVFAQDAGVGYAFVRQSFSRLNSKLFDHLNAKYGVAQLG